MSADRLTKFGSGVLAQQLTVSALRCSLVEAFGYNATVGEPGFFQIHNLAVPLSGGEVPAIVIPVGSLGSYSFNFRDLPWELATGCILAISSTGPTFTLGADLGWFTGRVLV